MPTPTSSSLPTPTSRRRLRWIVLLTLLVFLQLWGGTISWAQQAVRVVAAGATDGQARLVLDARDTAASSLPPQSFSPSVTVDGQRQPARAGPLLSDRLTAARAQPSPAHAGRAGQPGARRGRARRDTEWRPRRPLGDLGAGRGGHRRPPRDHRGARPGCGGPAGRRGPDRPQPAEGASPSRHPASGPKPRAPSRGLPLQRPPTRSSIGCGTSRPAASP